MEGSRPKRVPESGHHFPYRYESPKVVRLLPRRAAPARMLAREAGFLSLIIPATLRGLTHRLVGGFLSFLPRPFRRRGGGLFALLRPLVIGVVALQLFSPDTLRTLAPNWEQNLGLGILLIAGWTFLQTAFSSFATVGRAGFWFFACCVISSAIYHPSPDQRYEPDTFEVLDSRAADRLLVRARHESESWLGSIVDDARDVALGEARSAGRSIGAAVVEPIGGVLERFGALPAAIGSQAAQVGGSIGIASLSSFGFDGGAAISAGVNEISFTGSGLASANLPETAFFPPVRKTSGFYSMKSNDDSLLETVQRQGAGALPTWVAQYLK